MNNQRRIALKKGLIKEYQKIMIAEIQPEILLPVSFIADEEKDWAVYEYSGFRPIAEMLGKMSKYEFFRCLEKLIKGCIILKEYMLIPEKLILSEETVYVDIQKERIRIMYLPQEGEKDFNIRMADFITEIEHRSTHKDFLAYIAQLKKQFEKNPGIYDLLNMVSSIKREIYLCETE